MLLVNGWPVRSLGWVVRSGSTVVDIGGLLDEDLEGGAQREVATMIVRMTVMTP